MGHTIPSEKKAGPIGSFLCIGNIRQNRRIRPAAIGSSYTLYKKDKNDKGGDVLWANRIGKKQDYYHKSGATYFEAALKGRREGVQL